MSVAYKLPRGTRASLNAKATAGTIVVGQEYLITDENRLAVGVTANSYQDMALASERAAKGVGFSIATTAPSQVVPAPPSPYALTVSSASGITAKAQTAATASAAYTLKKNGTAVATITWAAGATVGVAALSGGVFSVAVGDVLTLAGPATADSTLAAISASVVGS